jgi:hypothetical protein
MSGSYQDQLMAKFCPSLARTSPSKEGQLTISQPRDLPVLEAECTTISQIPQQENNSFLTQLMQGQSAQMQLMRGIGNEVLANSQEIGAINKRLLNLEQTAPQPIMPYQQPQADVLPILHELYAQRQQVTALSTQQHQTNKAIELMASSIQTLAKRDPIVNYFVDNSCSQTTHTIEINGDYNTVCQNGDQKTGLSFWTFLGMAIVTVGAIALVANICK